MSSDCMASDATVSHYLVPLTEMSLGTKLTDKYRLKHISASIIKQLFYVFFFFPSYLTKIDLISKTSEYKETFEMMIHVMYCSEPFN